MARDFYEVLGVKEDISDTELKKIYRKLAKRYHPDRHKGDKEKETRFKEISEAYQTLSDKTKRAEYDQMRRYGAFAGNDGYGGGPFGAQGFDPSRFSGRGIDLNDLFGGRGSFHVNGQEMGGFEDILSSFFGGQGGFSRTHTERDPFGRQRTNRRQQQAHDLTATITIPFMEAVRGTKKKITLSGENKRTLSVTIPPGIEDGERIRLKGMGTPGQGGMQNGNLIITVRVMPDQDFERRGNDIHSSVEISFIEAINGCKKNVKTLTKTLALTIPPGTQPGTKLRLKGQGLAVGGAQGDQYVEVKVTIPTSLSEKQKQILDDWGE
jgi:DnaJ-class molecular chaperone